MHKRITYIFLILLFGCFFLYGCVNGRIWGDNFLRGWFHGSRFHNSITDKGIHSTKIQGLTGGETTKLVLCVSIPLIILLGLSEVSQRKNLKTSVSFLVMLIEHCQSADEMKRLSALFSHSNTNYRKLIDNELNKMKKE
ncbi:hypothetical protein J7L67_10090 [bacterium]|nr:hypothetical protein [bacterium]